MYWVHRVAWTFKLHATLCLTQQRVIVFHTPFFFLSSYSPWFFLSPPGREVKVRVSRGDMLSSIQLGLMTSLTKRKLSLEGFTLVLAKVCRLWCYYYNSHTHTHSRGTLILS